MKADLILVSHNSKEDLEIFLPSIRQHTQDFNLEIIDNGSQRPTLDFLRNCGEKILLKDNIGYGSACNVGARNSNSEFIVFLNCDLWVSENWLVDLLKPFEDSKVAVAGARLFTSAGQEYPTPNEGAAIGCCFAVRRKVFEELGGFDENFFLFFEETDFCLRATEAGYKVIRSEAKLTHFHPHFLPMSPELQKHFDKSKAYFEKKHGREGKKQTIALVMIAKNEELGLEQAIKSARPFVDEVVVAVDNSSTDKTLDVALKFADTVKKFDWQDDFSKARNFAHEGVKTDWIIFLDGHEYIAAAPDLEKHLLTKANGLMCAIEMENGMIFGNPRIYRNGFNFEGEVHERQTCWPIDSYPEFLIKHNRFEGQSPAAVAEREKQRKDQVPRIMGAHLKKNKKDTRACFHLALFYTTEHNFKAAIYWWERYLKYAKDKGERWYAFFELSQCHAILGHSFRAYLCVSKADRETPGRWEISRLRGLLLFQNRQFAKAAECFVESFSNNTCIVHYRPWVRDISGTYNLIGECLFNQRIFDKASLAFSEAAKTCEDKNFKKILEDRAKLMNEIFKSQFAQKVE